MRALVLAFSAALISAPLWGHAVPLYSAVPPIHVQQKGLYDATGRQVILAGVQMRGLEVFSPTESSRALVEAMTSLTFRIIRQRWNMNTVRLPVSPWIWRRDGQAYLDKVAEIIRRANGENLWVILVAVDDARAGAPFESGLPGPELAQFWSSWAGALKDSQMLVFDLYSRPSAQFVQGATTGVRRAADWTIWLNGGTATNGRAVVGMQALTAAIRTTGASQLIAAPAFFDSLDFRGFDAFINDPNILYEVYPYFDHALTDAQREINFGFLASKVPVYAGEWGAPLTEDSPSCRSVPKNPADATNAIIGMVTYMASRTISWTAASFEPSQMIRDFTNYEATQFDRIWSCGQTQDPQPGMGGDILYWITGDPAGFGSLLPELIANAAANRVGSIAPGEILTVYGQGLGPEQDVAGTIAETGQLGTSAGGTRVLFDGTAAPVFSAGSFQVTVQVPYELAGRGSATIQAFYRDVPSNKLSLKVEDAFPSLFTVNGFQDVLAINEDGFRNSSTLPAAPGSIITMYASGTGVTSPASVTGYPATAPYVKSAAAISVRIGGIEAELLYAGAAPGLIGLTQINARVPTDLISGDSTRTALVTLATGAHTVTGFRLWIR